MGAFNWVTHSTLCPDCGGAAEFAVQFKFGDTWQYSYRVGDRLLWGGNDVGAPGLKRVLVEGIAGPCPHCHADNLDFDVLVEKDRIVGTTPCRGGRAVLAPEGFVVLEP